MIQLARFIARHVYLTALLLVVASAVLLTAARVLTPLVLSHYAGEIADAASARLGQPVTIGGVSARWHGLGPALVLRDVSLGATAGAPPVLTLDSIDVDFGLADMVATGYLAPGRITVRGTRLTLVRLASGGLSIRGVTAATGGDASALLLIPARVRLQDARIEWVDELRGLPPVAIDDVELLIRNELQRHQVDADFRLGGQPVRLRADLTATTPGRLAEWSGRVYFRAEELDLGPLLESRLPAPFVLANGQWNGELWGEWSSGRLQKLAGTTSIRQLRVAGTDKPPLQVDEIGGRFDWRPTGAGWRLAIEDFNWRRDSHRWRAVRMQIDAIGAGSTTAQYFWRGDYADIGDLAEAAALLAPPAVPATELLGTRPTGELHDFALRLRPYAGPAFDVRGEFRHFGILARGKLPAVDNLSGWVDATNNGGHLLLATRDASVHPVQLFRWPLPIGRIEGKLAWERLASGWRVETGALVADNDHIRTRTRLRLDIPRAGRPFIDLQTDFRDGIGTYAPVYYPVGIMPPALVTWLDRAIADGRVPWGSCLLRGPLADFPFDRTHNGHFEVRFGVEDAVLDYHDGWPPLHDLVADVRFHNNSLEIRNGRGQLYDTALGEVEAVIPTLRPTAALEVRGKASGPLGDLFRFLRETPLRENYGPLVDDSQAEGNSRLDLAFTHPLNTGAAFAMNGSLTLDGATLESPALGIELTGIDGELGVTERGLTSDGLRATFAGTRLTAGIAPAASGGTRIRASGRFDTANLKRQFPALAALPLEGLSPWTVSVTIPPPARLGSGPLDIQATSSLEGTRVDLPLGLGKEAGESQPFSARVTLQRGTARDLEVTMGNLNLTGEPVGGGWRAHLNSPAATGTLFLPPAKSNEPVRAEFDRLAVSIDAAALAAQTAKPGATTGPDAIPETVLSSRSVLINGNDYGSLSARTRRIDGGIRLEEMRLESDEGKLTVAGEWTGAEDAQRTSLQLQLGTADIGRTLRDLALSESVANGKGEISADLSWNGAPNDIQRDSVAGEIRFHAEKGRFEEASPGVGRLFGLLNVTALQRRLRLDFSDLFQQGLAFDTIDGDFRLEGGVARTENTRIASPSGDIRIEGTTNLATTRMEQDISVVPAISGAVALAGGLAGGPVLGAALLAAGKGIDRLATVRYRMTGPWADPVVEPVTTPGRDEKASKPGGIPEIH